MQNFGDKCVNIPKYAVLGEVFILHPEEYEKEFIGISEEEEEGEEIDGEEDTEDTAQVNVVHHETTQFVDAEYNTTPSMPEIKESEPLPKDLQALVDKCTELSETERQELAKLLRKHHDIFAKDNTTFGKCPWTKFRIDTGDHPPIKQTARPIPIHYRQAVMETIKKYLEQGAIIPNQPGLLQFFVS